FDPTTDRLRIIGDDGQNLSVNPDTGSTTTGAPLSVSNLTGIAYTNSFVGAASTALYGIAAQGGDAALLGVNAATGATTLIHQLIGPTGPLATNTVLGFDVAAADNTAYLAIASSGGAATTVYVVNLSNGVATLTGNAGTVGGGVVLRGIAVA